MTSGNPEVKAIFFFSMEFTHTQNIYQPTSENYFEIGIALKHICDEGNAMQHYVK